MPGKLIQEIKQTKPFVSLEEETMLNILRTAAMVAQQAAGVLKPHDLSSTQYNVLRILRGAGPDGITGTELGDRLITKEPDVTRLLDRMQARGLVERERTPKDRRILLTKLSPAGAALVASLDTPVNDSLRQTIGQIPEDRQLTLIALLEQVREILNKNCPPA